MTTLTWQSPTEMYSLANLQAAYKPLSDFLKANLTWLSGIAGQPDWTAPPALPASGGPALYASEFYALKDTAQATLPLYLKVDYYAPSAANTYGPRLGLSITDVMNTSTGAITGKVLKTMDWSYNQSGAQSASPVTHYASCDGSFLSLLMQQQTGTANIMDLCLLVERLYDRDTGAAAYGAHAISKTTSALGYALFDAQSQFGWHGGVLGLLPNAIDGQDFAQGSFYGNEVYVWPVVPWTRHGFYRASRHACLYNDQDVAHLVPFDATIEGEVLTMIGHQTHYVYQSYNQSNTSYSSLSNYTRYLAVAFQ